jgi:hypothetical protein
MGRSHTCKMLNFAKDGAPLWNHLAIVPVRASSGTVTHFIGMQTFTPAQLSPNAPAGIFAEGSSMLRTGSHQCLAGNVGVGGVFGLKGRSSSHHVLTSLNPELVSPAGAALHGCMNVV